MPISLALATETGDLPEALDNGRVGFLADRNDDNEFADAM